MPAAFRAPYGVPHRHSIFRASASPSDMGSRLPDYEDRPVWYCCIPYSLFVYEFEISISYYNDSGYPQDKESVRQGMVNHIPRIRQGEEEACNPDDEVDVEENVP